VDSSSYAVAPWLQGLPPPQSLTASRLGHSQPEFSLLKHTGKGLDNFLPHRDESGQCVSLALL